MNNLKDKLSSIATILASVAGVIIAIQTQGIVLPTWLNTVAAVFGATSLGITSFLTGKNPDGSTKTSEQVEKILDEAKK